MNPYLTSQGSLQSLSKIKTLFLRLKNSCSFVYIPIKALFFNFEFRQNSFSSILITMKKKRVCVIGAGAAGLIAIRHIKENPQLEGCVFEQDESIGGVWNYTDNTGSNKYGLPIHSTAYNGLRTNLPKEIMGYLDYPFPDSNLSYISHKEVLRYLEKFTIDHKLEELINFTTRVISVTPEGDVKGSSPTYWKVQTEDLKTKLVNEHQFDSVIICNGHYTKPYKPEIKNLDTFSGEIWHSRDYRKPETFTGKKVIVLGGGPSAIDISVELAQTAAKVILSCKDARYTMPKNISIHSPVIEAKKNSFLTTNGEEIQCDAILLCSGYVYDFPFLSPKCEISVKNGKYIYPLYRHFIHARMPSMAFIGIPFTVCPFPQFDIQVRYFLKTLTGELSLPAVDQMLNEIEKEQRFRDEHRVPLNHSHKFGDSQWAYNAQLATEAGFPELIKPVIQKAYDRAGERRQTHPATYKYDYVRLIDQDNFEYIDDYYLESK